MMDDLRAIAEGIIKKGFPELYESILTLSYKKMKDSYLEHDKLRKGRYHINVDTSLKNAKGIVVGGLAHEFSHISRDINRSWFIHGIDI